MHLKGIENFGNYITITDKICIFSEDVCKNIVLSSNKIWKKLKMIPFRSYDQNFIGNMILGNTNGLIISNFFSDYKLRYLIKNSWDDIKILRLDDNRNNPGSFMAVSNFHTILGRNLQKKTIQKIKSYLKTSVYLYENNFFTINKFNFMIFENSCLISPVYLEYYLQTKKPVELPLYCTTVSNGCNYPGLALLFNKNICLLNSSTNNNELKVINKFIN